MERFQDANSGKRISEEKANELLYGNMDNSTQNQLYFDEFGNYVYPTDLIVSTPNTASGTAMSLSLFNGFCLG